MSLTSSDLAVHFGLAETDVDEILASKEQAGFIAAKYGLAPSVATALVKARGSRKK